MITITGKSVFGGVSIGKLSFYKRNQKVIKREHVENVESECVRFQEAKAEGIRQLKELYEKSIADVGEANAMIFEIHQMMLEDLDYIESIENIIRSQEVNAEFAVYKQVAENMAGKKVIIRTLDIGADKQVDYFGLDKEENPALGYRAIRICLTRPEIFKTQLRALYRAAFYGNISIMFPMIISVSEIHKIKEMIKEVKAELKEQGIPYKEDVELGVMIETPASVMISRELAKEVDFFSVGTNDLTQYTLAIDRQNSKLDEFYDPHHPAVLAMIRMAAENAHAEGKWIGICGELGADLELTEEFLKMGLDELSVSPSMVLPLRKKIRDCE